MDKTLVIDFLAIEVTRRCNRMCEHCLRGIAQNVDLDRETLSFFLKSIINKYNTINIHNLIITGGEPMLCREKDLFLDLFQELGINVDQVYLATNGMLFDEKIFMRLMNFAAFNIENFENDNERPLVRVDISDSPYHDYTSIDPLFLSFLPNRIGFNEKPMRSSGDDNSYEVIKPFHIGWKGFSVDSGIINCGLASDYGVGTYSESFNEKLSFRIDDGYDFIDDSELYIAANGNVIAGCNHSYEYIDSEENIISNIKDSDCFEKIIIKALEKNK